MTYFRKYLARIVQVVRYVVYSSKYGIIRGYRHRSEVPHYDDMDNLDEYQNEVYEEAKRIFTAENYNSVIDIGCGSAYKLVKFFKPNQAIGVEVEPTLSKVQQLYPSYFFCLFEDVPNRPCNLLICSDVIEHVPRPDLFIAELLNLDIDKFIFSTPDRDLLTRSLPLGPPRNATHFREWSYTEFNAFLSQFFIVENHQIVNRETGTQLAVCRKK